MKGVTNLPRTCVHCGKSLPIPRLNGVLYHVSCKVKVDSLPPRLRPNYEKRLQYNRGYLREIRRTVIEHYGGVCACCKESKLEFLVIDHIAGGGSQHRKESGLFGDRFYRFLIRNGFPVGYRVLCQNCNASLGHYGYCPHKRRTNDTEEKTWGASMG